MSPHSSQPYDRRVSRPLPIWWWTRVGDARDARRCGRSTPPLPEAHSDTVPSTSRIEAIRHHAQDSIEAERLSYLRDSRADRIRLAALQAELDSARTRLSTAVEERDETAQQPFTEERRKGESDLPPTSISRRRRAEHDRDVAVVAQLVTTALAEVDRLSIDIAEVEQRIAERLAAAQSRAHRLLERQSGRINHYRSALVAAHPDAARLNARFTSPAIPTPTWVATGVNAELGAGVTAT